jgi:hypothetical protein
MLALCIDLAVAKVAGVPVAADLDNHLSCKSSGGQLSRTPSLSISSASAEHWSANAEDGRSGRLALKLCRRISQFDGHHS